MKVALIWNFACFWSNQSKSEQNFRRGSESLLYPSSKPWGCQSSFGIWSHSNHFSWGLRQFYEECCITGAKILERSCFWMTMQQLYSNDFSACTEEPLRMTCLPFPQVFRAFSASRYFCSQYSISALNWAVWAFSPATISPLATLALHLHNIFHHLWRAFWREGSQSCKCTRHLR